MSFLDELKKGVKLNKTHTEDKSSALRAGLMTKQQVGEFHEYVAKFDAEEWVGMLGELTFQSEVVEIRYEEGVIIEETCREIEDYKAKIGARSWGETDLHKTLQIDVKKRFGDLISRIDSVIEKFDKNGVFAKMSCRSAKDVVTSKLKTTYNTLIEGRETDISDNDKVRCLLQAGVDVMKMTSGEEIMKVFTQSERILGDMGAALQYPARFRQNVILREWCDLDVGMEFRGFVSDNNFTALSQYNYFVCIPEVVCCKESISSTLQAFWSTSCREKLLPLTSYVIDFALLPTGGVKVIELNPFYETTSSALFNWKDPVIKNGPFEFRICEETPKKRPEIEPEYHAILGW